MLIYNIEKATNSNNEINANNTTTNATMNTPTTNTITSTDSTIATTTTTTTNNNNNNNNNNLNDSSKLEESITAPDNVPLRDIFHSLELDRAAMIEQRKLEVKISRIIQYIQSLMHSI